jgi:hypothetical protein
VFTVVLSMMLRSFMLVVFSMQMMSMCGMCMVCGFCMISCNVCGMSVFVMCGGFLVVSSGFFVMIVFHDLFVLELYGKSIPFFK